MNEPYLLALLVGGIIGIVAIMMRLIFGPSSDAGALHGGVVGPLGMPMTLCEKCRHVYLFEHLGCPCPHCIIEDLRAALERLERAEGGYRAAHDIYGDGHPMAGRAWDELRRAGDRARSLLDPDGEN